MILSCKSASFGIFLESRSELSLSGRHVPLIHIVDLESVWAHSFAVGRHMGATLHCYTGQVGPDLSDLMMLWLQNNDMSTWLRL
jgi:hypothetical protein